MAHFVYVLLSKKDGLHYIGLTNGLERRVRQHNIGQVRSTKLRRPLMLIYHEIFTSRIEAAKEEKYYKSGVGREKLKAILVASSANKCEN
jgi:putative endonuclease